MGSWNWEITGLRLSQLQEEEERLGVGCWVVRALDSAPWRSLGMRKGERRWWAPSLSARDT